MIRTHRTHRTLPPLLLLGTLLLGTLLLVAAPPALAAGERIAVVDMVALITEHPRATELSSLLEQRQSEAETYARDQQKEIRELQGDTEMLGKTNPLRRAKEKELVFKKELLKLELKFREQEANREYMDGLEALYAQVQRKVQKYAQDHAIQVVLLKTSEDIQAVDPNDYGAKIRLRTVVYHDPALDITPAIKALIQAERQATAVPPKPGASAPVKPAGDR